MVLSAVLLAGVKERRSSSAISGRLPNAFIDLLTQLLTLFIPSFDALMIIVELLRLKVRICPRLVALRNS